jgi:hypothetical protein
MVQVAEFCSTEPSTYQTAWVVAHLAGYYGLTWVMPIIEISGPGAAVFDELEKVRQGSKEIRPTEDEHNIRNFLGNMKAFFYKRIDTLGGSLAREWRSTEDLKRRAMNQLKDGIELGRVVPRSLQLLEEMRRIINDEGHIAAEGRAKDDRVIAAMLAYQAWSTWTRPKLVGMGMTRAKAEDIDKKGGTEPLDRLIVNFMKRQKIAVPT